DQPAGKPRTARDGLCQLQRGTPRPAHAPGRRSGMRHPLPGQYRGRGLARAIRLLLFGATPFLLKVPLPHDLLGFCMRRWCAIALLAGGLTLGAGAGFSQESKDGTVVKIAGLQSRTPADWVREKPSNRLRSFQFRLPRVKDEKEDAELAVLPD